MNSKDVQTGKIPGRITLLLIAILFPERVRIGVADSCNGGDSIYAVTVSYRGKTGIIFTGKKIPFWVYFCCPPFLYVDSGAIHLYYADSPVEENDDPDDWIEIHGDRLLPNGFSPGQLHTSWFTNQNGVRAVSVISQQLDERISFFARNGYVVSCLPALQGLANVLKNVIEGKYFIWKVMDDRSVLAYVNNGAIMTGCSFWAGRDDINEDPESVSKAVMELISSMVDGVLPDKIISLPGEMHNTLLSKLNLAPVRIEGVPEFPNCSEQALEAFGNTIDNGNGNVQLLPYEHKEFSAKVEKAPLLVAKIGRFVTMLTTGIVLITAGYLGLSRIFLSFDSKEMALVENEFTEMSATLAKKDSLFKIVSRKTAFKVDESTFTLLLSDLQTVFPDGVAAEEIVISELDNKSWRLTISAFAESASFIQKVIDEMQKIKGLSGARMVSSEQASEKDIPIGTRFKIEAVWR